MSHEIKKNKFNCTKIKNDHSVKNAVNKIQVSHKWGESICKNFCAKGILSKIHKKLKNQW